MCDLTVVQGAETDDENLKEVKAPLHKLDSTSRSQAGVKLKSEPIDFRSPGRCSWWSELSSLWPHKSLSYNMQSLGHSVLQVQEDLARVCWCHPKAAQVSQQKRYTTQSI